jgi:hypothetical protein
MSYYFPLGEKDSITTQNINYALLSVTSSVARTANVRALTASFATTTLNSPPAGDNGISVTLEGCQTASAANPSLLVSGAKGQQGPTGSKGTDVLTCPAGTVRCVGLEVSLSAQYNDGVTRGVNYYLPSGSQFSIVCMQVPTTCSSAQATAGCPDYLPITAPVIP